MRSASKTGRPTRKPVPVYDAFDTQLWYRIFLVSVSAVFSCRFMVPVFWYGFVAPISGTCVIGITVY